MPFNVVIFIFKTENNSQIRGKETYFDNENK